jgi:hypothetical protein
MNTATILGKFARRDLGWEILRRLHPKQRDRIRRARPGALREDDDLPYNPDQRYWFESWTKFVRLAIPRDKRREFREYAWSHIGIVEVLLRGLDPALRKGFADANADYDEVGMFRLGLIAGTVTGPAYGWVRVIDFSPDPDFARVGCVTAGVVAAVLVLVIEVCWPRWRTAWMAMRAFGFEIKNYYFNHPRALDKAFMVEMRQHGRRSRPRRPAPSSD